MLIIDIVCLPGCVANAATGQTYTSGADRQQIRANSPLDGYTQGVVAVANHEPDPVPRRHRRHSRGGSRIRDLATGHQQLEASPAASGGAPAQALQIARKKRLRFDPAAATQPEARR